MWPAILLFSAFWIADFRLKRYTWPQVFSTLCVVLAVLVPLAAFTPGWLWKTVLMAYLTFPWWLLPLTATRQPAAPAEPRIRPWDAEADGDLWPGLPGLVEDAAAVVEREGLVRLGLYREDIADTTQTLTALLETPDGTEAVTVFGATTLILPGTEAETRNTLQSTNVYMAFADGRRLAVTNLDQFPTPARDSVIEQFTHVDDPARLLRIARAYRARRFAGAQPAPVRGGRPPVEFWAERTRAGLEARAARGLYRRGADGAWYVTARGALVMGWALLLPFRQIGALRRRLRERRILRELGMEDAASARPARPRLQHPFDLQLTTAIAMAVLLILLD